MFACTWRPLTTTLTTAAAARARRLGSRLYFEFTAAALGDDVAWEGLADGVAVEVRRHGAAPPSSPQSVVTVPAAPAEVAVQDGEVDATAAASPAKVLAPAAVAPRSPMHRVAAPAGVGSSSSVVHVDNRNTVNHNITNHSGNMTSTNNIVLM